MITQRFVDQRIGTSYARLSTQLPVAGFLENCAEAVIININNHYPEEEGEKYRPYIEDGILKRLAREFGFDYNPLPEDDVKEIFGE